MGFSSRLLYFLATASMASAFIIAVSSPARASAGNVILEDRSNLGIIRGMVRDESGNPIADATVAIFRLGTSQLLKQVRSASNGSFLARILPGTYTVLAVAQGFNPVTLSDVEVNRSAELVYGFRLERAGGGNTLPEKRLDRNSSKWRIRAAQMQRSIYQDRDGAAPVDEAASAGKDDATAEDPDPARTNRRGRAVVETYFANTAGGNYTGVNFAALVPAGSNAEVVFAGQAGAGKNSPLRLETEVSFRPNAHHQVRVNTSYGRLGTFLSAPSAKTLGQFSLQAIDEWRFRDGVILVVGMDYSRFTGAGDDYSLSPRVGFQFDVNSKTRVRSAFTTQTDDRSWARAVDIEGSTIVFRDPVAVDDLAVRGEKPRMNKSNRLEFGIERVLDNRSSIEANAFFDTTFVRGVGLNSLPLDSVGGGNLTDFVANQQGNARGLRVVYSRRLGGPVTVSAGYSFGGGQKLSPRAITNPSDVFETSFFQSFFSQIAADLRSGTSVKTVFRLSPQATVFAIDPFKGRLAIYDPGLSVYITQSLPTLGLPIRAEAVVDARNLLDFQSGVRGDDGGLRINSQGRTLRGGILVRF
jgi:hypothetical protein